MSQRCCTARAGKGFTSLHLPLMRASWLCVHALAVMLVLTTLRHCQPLVLRLCEYRWSAAAAADQSENMRWGQSQTVGLHGSTTTVLAAQRTSLMLCYAAGSLEQCLAAILRLLLILWNLVCDYAASGFSERQLGVWWPVCGLCAWQAGRATQLQTYVQCVLIAPCVWVGGLVAHIGWVS